MMYLQQASAIVFEVCLMEEGPSPAGDFLDIVASPEGLESTAVAARPLGNVTEGGLFNLTPYLDLTTGASSVSV